MWVHQLVCVLFCLSVALHIPLLTRFGCIHNFRKSISSFSLTTLIPHLSPTPPPQQRVTLPTLADSLDITEVPICETGISCDNLLCDGHGRPPNPLVVIQVTDGQNRCGWVKYARTEVIEVIQFTYLDGYPIPHRVFSVCFSDAPIPNSNAPFPFAAATASTPRHSFASRCTTYARSSAKPQCLWERPKLLSVIFRTRTVCASHYDRPTNRINSRLHLARVEEPVRGLSRLARGLLIPIESYQYQHVLQPR